MTKIDHQGIQVVEAVLPDGVEDEEKLDKHCAERQNPTHEDGRQRLHVPDLIRDLARNRVRAHRVLDGILTCVSTSCRVAVEK